MKGEGEKPRARKKPAREETSSDQLQSEFMRVKRNQRKKR
jgi:hypothetical protein